jgi:hypothetical protein
MFNEYDSFRLRKPLPDGSIPVGSRGVILVAFAGQPRSYEVEFPDGQGSNLGKSISYTITEDFMSHIDG